MIALKRKQMGVANKILEIIKSGIKKGSKK